MEVATGALPSRPERKVGMGEGGGKDVNGVMRM